MAKMNSRQLPLHSIALTLIMLFISSHVQSNDFVWKQVDTGLFVGEFAADQKSISGDSRITVIKIDPAKYAFRLMCASQLNHSNLTVKQWCRKYGLIAAINAGMYQTDYKSNVGYMKNFSHVNNSRISSKYHSAAAFNPIDGTKPNFRIYDVDEENIKEIIQSYNTVVQNLRLIKRPATNRWAIQDKKWSEAVLGQDQDGNVLFILSRSPHSMHDLNNILISLPIGIVCAQHLEGGPEASLYFSHNNTEIEAVGSYETGFNPNDANAGYWPVPNVIGFVKRTE